MTSVFDRWKHALPSSGPFRVYKQYYEELNKDYWASVAAHSLVYKEMTRKGTTWDSPPAEVLPLPPNKFNFPVLREWSDSYNSFQSWVRLNTLVGLTSILETFIDTVSSLAIESNPGLLINSDKSLDGLSLLKSKRLDEEIIKSSIAPLTKGDWPSRISAFNKLFNGYPTEIYCYLGDLEDLRKRRNTVGHAFGRDIAQSRKFEEIKALPQTGVSEENLLNFFDVTFKVAKAIDTFLLDRHIGEYQALFAFHIFKKKNNGKKWNQSTWANSFRKAYTTTPLGKQFFLDLVDYYEKV